jgi:transposase InsO family protein
MGVHHSTYYRWKHQVDRFGLEILRPRERRQPRMPNAISQLVVQRIVAFALGYPGFGPLRISAELKRQKSGGIKVSPAGIWRVLRRHGLNTRSKRLSMVAGYAVPPEPEKREPGPERHIEASRPGELVQMDCLYIGRLSGVKGAVWQYTAIDVASAFTWAELHTTPRNPSARWTSQLARRVASDLSSRGWELERVMTDNAAEYRSSNFRNTIQGLHARHTFIRAGRPQANGCVERVQGTILEECQRTGVSNWKPAFARYLIPKTTGLARDLKECLRYYNYDQAHTGKWTRGRTPEQVIGKNKIWAW